ncbi:hypothetical protein BCR37DRAFT_376495, partial [Protomyces lactucae-debilis]
MKNKTAEGCPFIFIRLELEARKTRCRTHKTVRQETRPKSQKLWATSSQTRQETKRCLRLGQARVRDLSQKKVS